MPNFNVSVDHDSQREEVVSRLQGFSDRIRENMPVDLTFAFSALGFKVSGVLEACDKKVAVNGKLPFAALPFRGAIETQISEKISEAISAS
jgi:antitoxin component of RelBE/YafQ-DinJ toxin-antitoxin module